MAVKKLNLYRITHKDGSIENLNAQNLIQALSNLEEPESVSPVIQTFMSVEGTPTLVNELPKDISFVSIVEGDDSNGNIATPASGIIHAGDQIQLNALPARNYTFVAWKRNGVVISEQADFVYIMADLAEGEDTAVFTASFRLSPLTWTSAVSPEEASGAGCVAFPASGTVDIGQEVGIIAVAEEGYTFDHWERNGQSVGTNKVLSVPAESLAPNESSAVYTAVFTVD